MVTIKQEQAQSGEDRLIARYFKPLAQHAGAFGLEDDVAAITPPAGCDLVITADGIVAGVHFFADDPADAVARKALRVNLSDIAAKGAQPIGFLLTLALPDNIGDPWLAAFAHGLGEDAVAYSCPLLGGDTVRTLGPVAISIAAFAAVARGRTVRRAGAKAGDRLVVTGTIGDAALGLLLRRDPLAAGHWGLPARHRHELEARYLLPQPRTAIAELVGTHASAAMDVSDGLAGDLAKLCRASGVAAEIEIARVPLSEAGRAALARDPGLMETLLTGGDDYEILASVPANNVERFRSAAMAAGVAITEIGSMLAGDAEARLLDQAGQPLSFARPSFSHF